MTTTVETLLRQMTTTTTQLKANEMRSTAVGNEYAAALMLGDAKELQWLRDTMHALLDVRLDLLGELMEITKKAQAL